MESSTQYAEKISDFIYKKPELIAVLLIKYGYFIDTNNRRLIDILDDLNLYTFELLYAGNKEFAKDLSSLMIDEGYVYAGGGIVSSIGSLGSSIIGAFTAKSTAKKQNELQANIANANLSSKEKLGYSMMQTEAETEIINNITSNVAKYRDSLNTEVTKRTNNTWIYIVAIGGSLAILYVLSKKS